MRSGPSSSARRPNAPVSADDYRARGVLYVPERRGCRGSSSFPKARTSARTSMPPWTRSSPTNPGLRDVLPRGYQRLEKSVLLELVRLFSPLPRMVSGDAFGLIYEDFLPNFAMAEGRLGGEFFTP